MNLLTVNHVQRIDSLHPKLRPGAQFICNSHLNQYGKKWETYCHVQQMCEKKKQCFVQQITTETWRKLNDVGFNIRRFSFACFDCRKILSDITDQKKNNDNLLDSKENFKRIILTHEEFNSIRNVVIIMKDIIDEQNAHILVRIYFSRLLSLTRVMINLIY